MSPLNVYLDESGANAKWSPEFLWAGYSASWRFWQRFGDAWNKILDRDPVLPYWHQVDARTTNRTVDPDNPYRTLTAAQVKRRERSLAKLIHDNREYFVGICMRVSYADLQQHVEGQIRLSKIWSREEHKIVQPKVLESAPWIALFHASALIAELNNAEPIRMPISLHCEATDNKYQPYMLLIWDRLKRLGFRQGKELLGSLDFPPGKTRDTPQLQVADMLAWHLNLRAAQKAAGKNEPDDPMWQYVQGRYLHDQRISVDHLQKHVALWQSFPGPYPKV